MAKIKSWEDINPTEMDQNSLTIEDIKIKMLEHRIDNARSLAWFSGISYHSLNMAINGHRSLSEPIKKILYWYFEYLKTSHRLGMYAKKEMDSLMTKAYAEIAVLRKTKGLETPETIEIDMKYPTKHHTVYEYNGLAKNGRRWLRNKIVATFANFDDYHKYIWDNDDKLYFGVTDQGIHTFTMASVRFTKEQNAERGVTW